jgi:hypothetical protein
VTLHFLAKRRAFFRDFSISRQMQGMLDLGLLQKSKCLSEAFSDQIKAPKAPKMTK